MSRTQISISTLLSCLDNFDCYISYDVGRDGKMCGYCQYYWGYIRANFFLAVLIFWLLTRKQTINTVLFWTVLKAIS